MRTALPLGLLLLAACTPDDRKGGKKDGDSAPPSITPTGTVTGSTTAGTTTVPSGVVDCANLPDAPLLTTPLDAPRGYNDVVFDLDGALVGHDGDVFHRATAPDQATVLAPLAADVYKMGLLPGGDVVGVTDTGALVRVTPAGSVSTVFSGVVAYGLAVGSDGMVYISTNYGANGDGILRVDPDTGDFEILIDAAAYPPRAIGFSRDDSVLYFGTLNDGEIYRVPFDANHDPSGDPELLITVPAGWHDTLEVDACGNLYVGSFFSSSIFRIDGNLAVSQLIQWETNLYGHGFEWGDPNGGWNDHAIYVTHPYIGSKVDEIQIGVPGRQWTGEVVGGVTL